MKIKIKMLLLNTLIVIVSTYLDARKVKRDLKNLNIDNLNDK